MQKLLLFIRLTRPLFLVGAVLLYALGAGIARYLGGDIDWGAYWLGQAWVTFLQLSTHYLNEYFDWETDAANEARTIFSGGSGTIGEDKLSRSTPFYAAATTLTVTASLTVLLIQRGDVTPLLLMVMVLTFLGAFFYSTPPVRLASSGYGELTTSFLVANLVPAIGFLLQQDFLHSYVLASTLPLTALHMAMLLAFEFPDYASDLKYEKNTLLVRMGWEDGMRLHNLLIFSAYSLLGFGLLAGLPLFIVLPAFIPLPLGLLQVWQMRKIAEGRPPNWSALTINAVALLAGTAYMLMYSFWTR